MAEAKSPASSALSDLSIRAISGVVMAGLALGADWLGGWPFALFWLAAAITVLVEWERIVGKARGPIVIGVAVLLVSTLLAFEGATSLSLLAILAGAAVTYGVRRGKTGARFAAFGLVYAGAIAVPIILIRNDPLAGSSAVLFLFAVVWTTDIMAYFIGRMIGGPKLMPAISPKKTWSGSLGGLVCGTGAGVGVGFAADCPDLVALTVVAAVLSVVSQAGDLFESWIKRRFGTKDASHIIPGHGGAMDRLDGFVAAASLAFLIGVMRDPAAVATGLLRW